LKSEAIPKRCRISIVRAISLSLCRINMTTSSAYNEIHCGRTLLARGCNISSATALENICPNTSITKIKSIGERGSPFLSPFL
jgi:hypothetical protein